MLLSMRGSAIVVILALADLVRHNFMNAMALLFILHSDGRQCAVELLRALLFAACILVPLRTALVEDAGRAF